MISEFEVIRMLLEIQAAPVYAPAKMMVKTKDALITGGIRKMLDRAESVQKPEQKSAPPLIREKEMTQAKIAQPPSGGSDRNLTKANCWL